MMGRMGTSHSETYGSIDEENSDLELQIESPEDMRRKLIKACRSIPLSAG